MNYKNLFLILLILAVFSCTQSKPPVIFETTLTYPEELQQLHKNVLSNLLSDELDVTEVTEIYANLNNDGTWPDADYPSKTRGSWSPRTHLGRLLGLAKAYQNPASELYQKEEVSAKIHAALNNWLINDFQSPNWWHPVIGTPMVLNPILILMEPELSSEQLEKAMPILNRCEIGRTGQNKVWQSGNVLFTSLLIRNVEMLRKAAESIQEELVVSTGEGVQPDWSYHQHGPQLQFGNYGLSYVGDMIKWISILRETQFKFDENKVEILRNYLLDGQQWVIWNKQMDISACGRQLFVDSPADKAQSLAKSFKKMESLDPEFTEDYQNANDYRNLLGNKHFWRSDFHVKRTPEFYVSVKMNSERVIGAESCNAENLQGYYMGDGATFIYQTGEEYRNIFPFLDWKKIPGTTTQQDKEKLPVLTSRGYRIESDFVGGLVGNVIGKYPANSVAAMKYNRNGVEANKTWFFLEDMIVCLGSGISSKSEIPIVSGINQVFLNRDFPVEKSFDSNSPGNEDWILHDKIGYYFPVGGNAVLETKEVNGSWSWVADSYPDKIEKADIFKLYLDHGTKPKSGQYQYIVVPQANKSLMENIKQKLPQKIISETDRHEVVSNNGWSTAIVFYKPGKSDALGGVEVDKPCILIIDELIGATSVRVNDPTQKLQELNIRFKNDWIIKHAEVKTKNEVNIKFISNEKTDNSFQFTITKK